MKTLSIFSSCFVLMVFCFNAYDQQVWTLRNPLPTYCDLRSICYAKGMFFAADENGNVLSSPDCKSWTTNYTQLVPKGWYVNSIAWSGAAFVAIATTGSTSASRLFSSTDGSQWTLRANVTPALHSVIWGGGQFVAVGDNGEIMVSPDGASWVDWSFGTNNLTSAAWGNGKYVAVGDQNATIISSDGKTWTHPAADSTWPRYFGQICWWKDKFIDAAQYNIYTSINGQNWSKTVSPYPVPITGISFSDNMIAAVGCNGGLISSSDGVSWAAQNPLTDQDLWGIAYGNNQFSAVGSYGIVLSSSDGTSWTSLSSGYRSPFRGITFGNGKFIAAGDSGYILSSMDGISWSKINSGTSNRIWDIAYGNGVFAAVGDDSCVLVSSDGASWAKKTAGNWNTQFCSIAYGNNMFLASDRSGNIFTSSDNNTWIAHNGIFASRFFDIIWTGSKFVGINNGANNSIYTSSDGLSWTRTFASKSIVLQSLANQGDKIIAVGTDTALVSNDNGSTWTKTITGAGKYQYFWAAGYGNNQFIAVGDSGNLFTSSDGVTWKRSASGVTDVLQSIAYGNNMYVAVGDRGIILSSPARSAVRNSTKNLSNSDDICFIKNSIRFSLPHRENIKADLYNMQGRLICSIFNGTLPAGLHSLPLPRNIINGTYLLSLEAGIHRINQRITVWE